ncbi:MAG: hypothetical protein QXL12_02785 [Nitrososphaerota archaeon]
MLSSAYNTLRRYGLCIVVVKNYYSNGGGLEKTIPEIMRFAGFNNIEVHRFLISKLSAFAEYHRRRGHRLEHLQYEYVIAGLRTGRRRTISDEASASVAGEADV